MSDPANPLIAKLEAMADGIDPSVDGIAVLIVGDIQIELGCTTTGDSQFDAMRLATALEQAVRMGSVKPREVDAAAVIAGQPTGPVGDDAHLPYLSQLFRRGAS
ncbi:MAG: hypothetical protein WAL59_23250 [Roseiarcus sp.]